MSFFRNKIMFLVAGLLVVGIIVAVYFYLSNPATAIELKNPKIAVIPFTNLTPDSETDYLKLAFSDEIVKSINLVSKHKVTKLAPTKPEENLNQILEKYRTEKKIDLVIVGEYAISPNEIDITAKLVNTTDKKVFYTKSFTVANKNISTIPQIVAGEIVKTLRLRKENSVDFLIKPQNIDEQVYRDYLKALSLNDQQRTEEAIPILEKVVEREPNFITAWKSLAYSYKILAYKALDTQTDYYAKTVETLEKIRTLEPDNPLAAAPLVGDYVDMGRLEDGLKLFRSLPENPSKSEHYRREAMLTMYGGLLDESVNLIKETNKIDPTLRFICPQLYFNGEYEEYKRIVTPTVDEPGWHSFTLGLVALYQNDLELARKHFTDDKTYSSEGFKGLISQAFLLHLDGKTSDGLNILNGAEQRVINLKYYDGSVLYYLAQAYSYLGDKKSAIRVFKKTVENGFVCYPYFVRDPMMDKLRNDQEFKQILESARQRHLKFKELYYSETP